MLGKGFGAFSIANRRPRTLRLPLDALGLDGGVLRHKNDAVADKDSPRLLKGADDMAADFQKLVSALIQMPMAIRAPENDAVVAGLDAHALMLVTDMARDRGFRVVVADAGEAQRAGLTLSVCEDFLGSDEGCLNHHNPLARSAWTR